MASFDKQSHPFTSDHFEWNELVDSAGRTYYRTEPMSFFMSNILCDDLASLGMPRPKDSLNADPKIIRDHETQKDVIEVRSPWMVALLTSSTFSNAREHAENVVLQCYDRPTSISKRSLVFDASKVEIPQVLMEAFTTLGWIDKISPDKKFSQFYISDPKIVAEFNKLYSRKVGVREVS